MSEADEAAKRDRWRVKVLLVSRSLFPSLFRGPGPRYVIEGLPEDAECVGASDQSAFLHEQMAFRFRSREWEPVPEARPIPVLRLTATPAHDAIREAVAAERRRCADIAWKMQHEQFGGGSAIGNAIMEEPR